MADMETKCLAQIYQRISGDCWRYEHTDRSRV